jgi:dipeptidyl aminopeptidase/acylaminoacyl peptidase
VTEAADGEGKQQAPFGSWPSPLGAERLAAATIRFGQVAVVGENVYWSESRPGEGGRSIVVACDRAGRAVDRNPAPYDARTRVHEYGGGAFAVAADGELFFCNDADQRVYRVRSDAVPQPVTAPGKRRFADLVVDAARGRLIAVREEHGVASGAVNAIVAIDLASGAETVLASGHDFFSSPRLSGDGTRLAWLSWDHPRMPWQGSELWVAALDAAGMPGDARRAAGGVDESVGEPRWSPAGELHFVSDRSGWWNLYRERSGRIDAIHPEDAEFGEAHWVFGQAMYGFAPDGSIVCVFDRDGRSHLARIAAHDDVFSELATSFCTIRNLRVSSGFVACIAAAETEVEAIVRLDLASGAWRVLRRASDIVLDPGDVSVAEAIAFPGSGGALTHAFYYPPRNRSFTGPAGSRPPLLVVSHGGPTGATTPALALARQYWTSRGFAVVDVNYGGSTGYGRAYRERLAGQWGIVDVDDVVAAARFLVARGDVDGTRLAIRGGSAGGYTTLAALTFRDAFHAGASHFGVSDLEALARETHKFESRYLDSLIGPWPAAAEVYRARSPIHFPERMTSALILLQGAEDKAVPPSQAETMYRAVRAKGLPVAYLLFEGEQHGFRRAATIRRAFEAELYFYGRVFGFTPAGAIEPVAIDNLGADAAPRRA